MTKDTGSGNPTNKKNGDMTRELEELREKVHELEETLLAIQSGEVDAIVIANGEGRKVYTLEGADHPYRALIENIREGALTLSRTGAILYTNSRFADMVKLPAEKVAGRSILDFVCQEYRPQMELALKEILKRPCRSRVRILQGKGSLPVYISMNPLFPDNDTKISVVITDRRKDEERLRLQARMLDAVGDAVIAADTHNRIIYWNNAATKTYGWTPEEAVGRDLIDVVTPEITKKEARGISDRLKKGGIWTGEYIVRHRDGHEFPIYANGTPVFDDEGKLIAIIGASHDITDRVQAERELTDRNRELNVLNEELVAIQEELRQTNDELTNANESLQMTEEGLKKKHNDLNVAYEEITLNQEELRQGIEELTNRENQLNDALAEREVLLSEIHHRVKNNLTAFISLLSLENAYDNSPAGLTLKKDLQNRARSMALIHETLYRTKNYSRVNMDVYLSTLVGQITNSYEALKSVKTIVHASGITLDLSRATPVGLIINELLTNSLKYAFPASFDCETIRGVPCTIEVNLTHDDGSYILMVRDNGIGLPDDFDIATTKTLGLKLVNFLAKHQLRASIEVHSYRGADFRFRFKDKK
jgi:PAS domain S-box-containing protein